MLMMMSFGEEENEGEDAIDRMMIFFFMLDENPG
jgi:hypothetical protein